MMLILGGSLNLLDCMAKVCCNEIIFSSSATVYGELTQPPYSEKDYVSPKSPYGRTKQVLRIFFRIGTCK